MSTTTETKERLEWLESEENCRNALADEPERQELKSYLSRLERFFLNNGMATIDAQQVITVMSADEVRHIQLYGFLEQNSNIYPQMLAAEHEDDISTEAFRRYMDFLKSRGYFITPQALPTS